MSVGDTVAVLESAALATARLDVEEAQADLEAARAARPPASGDPVTLRQRLATAEQAVRFIQDRHDAGVRARRGRHRCARRGRRRPRPARAGRSPPGRLASLP